MSQTKEQLVRKWADPGINRINKKLATLDDLLFYSYEPSFPPRKQFMERFESWLQNVEDDDDKKLLFYLAEKIFYIGPDEFIELYRYAYNGPIARWLIDEANVDILSSSARRDIQKAVGETWFCPITDSMRINSFFHINNIQSGNDHRPDWRSMECFGDREKIISYMDKWGLKRLVLLEDFIGGGTQASKALQFAGTLCEHISLLVVPLVICPSGLEKLRALEEQKNISVSPIVTIPKSEFVPALETDADPVFFTNLRNLANSTYDNVAFGSEQGGPPYAPLGFPPDAPTGGLIVMFSNTPDNTLPLIHWRSGRWVPLFPRHRRV